MYRHVEAIQFRTNIELGYYVLFSTKNYSSEQMSFTRSGAHDH